MRLLIESEQSSSTSEPPPSLNHQDNVKIQSKYAHLVDKTCQFLLEYIAENHSLEELASMMFTNRNTLSKAFNQELNCSVFRWLRLQRMEQAKKFLKETHCSIQEISALVGYEEPANFSTTFRSICGISPKKYRNYVLSKEQSEDSKGKEVF